MADIFHLFAAQTALSTDTVDTIDVFQEPTNTCSISGSLLDASTEYLLIAKGRIGGETFGGHINIRVSTADDTTIASLSAAKWEPGTASTGSGKGAPWMFVRSYTTDASPADVKIEITRSDTSSEIYTDQLSLVLINLDDIGSSNYIEATYDTVSDVDGGLDLATISTLAASTEYLFIGYGRIDVNNASFSHGIDLYDGTTQKTAAYMEGEDTREVRVFGVMGAWTTAGTPNDAKIVGTGESAGVADSNGSYLIAIKTSVFDDFEYSFAATGGAISSTPSTIATISSYAPTAPGYHLVLGRYNAITQAAIGATVQVASTDVLDGDITPKTFEYDTTDNPNVEVVGVVGISSTSDVDLVASSVSAETSAYEFVAVAWLESLPTISSWGAIPIGI